MILLRSFEKEDASELQKCGYADLALTDVEALICEWENKRFDGKYFEMLAIVSDGKIVGTVSLYQHSSEVVSIGPEVFGEYRRKGIGKEAVTLACQFAKEKGFKIVSQQIRTNNAASIALHRSLGFETNGFEYTNSKGNEVSIYLKCLI